ncbi:MAG: hypothetical protein H0V07_06520 [Propionibacteriales bacterium]|nr:hypothetical protein [Propionibacteriales bacterium]
MNKRTSRTALAMVWPAMVTCLLASCSGSSGGDGAAAGTGPSGSTSSAVGDLGSTALPHLAGDSTPLAPGTYLFSFHANPGVETPDAIVEVPSGFNDGADTDADAGESGGWYVVSHDGDAFLGLWTVGKVQRDACIRPLQDYFTPGPTVDNLADALVAQKSTRASTRERITLAGHEGLYVELASPRDISRCDPNPGLWGDPGGRGIYSDNQIDQVWILDVDGQRLVVNASYGPTATTSEIDELTSMVKSLEFVSAGQG